MTTPTRGSLPLFKANATRACEVSWFAPLCNDDYEFLGVPDPQLKSSFEHVAAIVKAADAGGFNNMLFPSSFQVGQDPLCFAGAMAPQTHNMSFLVAIRTGEVHPPMLARALATLDHVLHGRLTINIITSDLPGETASPELRHQRAREVIQILKGCWQQDRLHHKSVVYPDLQLNSTDPAKMLQQNGGPLLYFGGLSPLAKDLCAEFCDVFLMWPEREEQLQEHIYDMSQRAAAYDRLLDFGLRIHLIVRDTEAQARAAADRLVSRLDAAQGEVIRSRAQDAGSYGVGKQTELRLSADAEGYAEDILWTGIGRARSGCGAALVGTPDQILSKIQRYVDMGIRAFIFSGYPHLDECHRVAQHILPRLQTMSLARFYGRVPEGMPATPLGAGSRR
jgi:alkanesulfonate monooxygenase